MYICLLILGKWGVWWYSKLLFKDIWVKEQSDVLSMIPYNTSFVEKSQLESHLTTEQNISSILLNFYLFGIYLYFINYQEDV